MPYRVVQVPADAATQLEQLGTKAKFWYQDGDDERILFKEGRPNTGENWAEKVSCEICRALRLPHAEYELAEWREKPGVISPTFVPDGCRLVLGNELLAQIVVNYEQTMRYRSSLHTVRRAMLVAKHVEPPFGWACEGITDGSGAFVGYLMLDAVIGNQDRHHENWGIVVMNERICLAPTFDHASSLGRNETDEARAERLVTKDSGRMVETFAARARSAFYPSVRHRHSKPLTTLEAFLEAVRINPEAGTLWGQRLTQVANGEIFRDLLSRIPLGWASTSARDFALKMLQINSGRILDALR